MNCDATWSRSTEASQDTSLHNGAGGNFRYVHD